MNEELSFRNWAVRHFVARLKEYRNKHLQMTVSSLGGSVEAIFEGETVPKIERLLKGAGYQRITPQQAEDLDRVEGRVTSVEHRVLMHFTTELTQLSRSHVRLCIRFLKGEEVLESFEDTTTEGVEARLAGAGYHRVRPNQQYLFEALRSGHIEPWVR